LASSIATLTVDGPEDKMLTKAGTDFGQNAKALWMIRWTGLITGRADLVAFAEESARALFRQAYQDDCGSWADGFARGGALDVNKTWWIYAELDQLAGTLALHDSALTKSLSRAYEYWFSHFIDNAYGEVWNGVDGTGRPVAICRSNGRGRTPITPSNMHWSATSLHSSSRGKR
jgi:hypothetical protein